MEREVVPAGATARRLVELVDVYSRRVYGSVLEQHEGESVSSPLGVWLLLAACASGAIGEDRQALERSPGCAAEEAGELLALFVAEPPSALKAGIAAWVRAADATAESPMAGLGTEPGEPSPETVAVPCADRPES